MTAVGAEAKQWGCEELRGFGGIEDRIPIVVPLKF